MNFNFGNNQAVSPVQAAAINQNYQIGQGGYQLSGVPAVGAPMGGQFAQGGFGLPQQQGKAGFFQPGGGAGLALAGIQTIGSLWSSFQQNKLAKKALGFQKDAFNINLGNQTKQYNTSLEDRVRARYATEGRSEQADAYIAKNKLADKSI